MLYEQYSTNVEAVTAATDTLATVCVRNSWLHHQSRIDVLALALLFRSIPFIVFVLLFSLPPSRNPDPGSHSRLFSTPNPPRFAPCIFFF